MKTLIPQTKAVGDLNQVRSLVVEPTQLRKPRVAFSVVVRVLWISVLLAVPARALAQNIYLSSLLNAGIGVRRYTVLSSTSLKTETVILLHSGEIQLSSDVSTEDPTVISEFFLPVSGYLVYQLSLLNILRDIGKQNGYVDDVAQSVRIYPIDPFPFRSSPLDHVIICIRDVCDPNPPYITSGSVLPPATVNKQYTTPITRDAGSPPFTWSIVSGRPPGLDLAANSGDSVVFSGIPTQAGTFKFQVKVVDSKQREVAKNFSLTVTPALDTTPPTVAISSPTGGQSFNTPLIAVSGAAGDPGSPSSGVALVQVRVNGGTWQPASGTTSWNASVALILGINTIDARSQDMAGNYSSPASVAVIYSQITRTGLTIITHGSQPIRENWPVDMAKQIRENHRAGKIIVLNFDNGEAKDENGVATPFSLGTQGETIVVLDWSGKSDNTTLLLDAEPGWREAVGDFLANTLLGSGMIRDAKQAQLPIHFIGHSFGTVVNSEAIRRLAHYDNSLRVHMTTLDPHDQNQDWIPDAKNDPPVVVWSNVEFADNYWQDNCGVKGNPTDNVLPPIALPVGHPIFGAANRDLTEGTHSTPGELAYAPHSRIHNWYYRTILGNPEPGSSYQERPGDNWYLAGAATRHGYALAALHRTSTVDFASLGMTAPPVAYSGPIPRLALSETVFNGDFKFDDSSFGNLPGYSDSDSPTVVRRESGSPDKAAELSQRKRSFTHRPVYFPPDATAIQFDYHVSNAGSEELLSLRASGLSQGEWSGPLSAFGAGWSSTYAKLIGRESLKGKWAELKFSIEAPGVSDVAGTVLIDNLQILTSAGFIREMTVSAQGQLQFTVIGEPNRSYVIQRSDDLKIWTTVETRTATDGIIRVTDTITAGSKQRFYRVASP